MSDTFVPLLPPRPAAGPANNGSSSIPAAGRPAEKAVPFVPVKSAGPAPSHAAHPMPGSAASPPGYSPKISLERDGDCIKRIRIECACGHIVELECSYGP